MVESVDTLDLKSNGKKFPCGFKSRSEYLEALFIDLIQRVFLCLILKVPIYALEILHLSSITDRASFRG